MGWLKKSGQLLRSVTSAAFKKVCPSLIPVSKAITGQVGCFLNLVVFMEVLAESHRQDRYCHFL